MWLCLVNCMLVSYSVLCHSFLFGRYTKVGFKYFIQQRWYYGTDLKYQLHTGIMGD